MTVRALNPESLAERMVAELNQNPEARRLLLRALLTDEFLMLPAKVDRLMDLPDRVGRLEEDVVDLKAGQARMEGDIAELRAGQARMEGDIADLKAGQARMEGDIADLKAGQARMEGDIADLKANQNRMQGQLGNLTGNDYERRMSQNVLHIVSRTLGMRRAKVLKGITTDAGELNDKVNDAEARGAITHEQGDKLLWADAVVSGVSAADRSPLHAVVEISVTIGETDVVRAAERSAILSAVMGEQAKGVVVGDGISEPDRRRAERADVAVELIRQ